MEKTRKFSKRAKVLFALIVILFMILISVLVLYFLQGDVKVINPNPYDVENQKLKNPEKDSYELLVDDFYFKNSKSDAPLSFINLYDSRIVKIQFNQGLPGDIDHDKEYTDITFSDIQDNILKDKTVLVTLTVKRLIGRTREIKVLFNFSSYTFAYLDGEIVEMKDINNFFGKQRYEKALEFADKVIKKYPAYAWYKDELLSHDQIVNMNYYARTINNQELKGYDIYSSQVKKSKDFRYDVVLDLDHKDATIAPSVTLVSKINDGDLYSRPLQDPELRGYQFIGWYDFNDKLYDFSTPITRDTTLFAKWKLLQYQIEYVDDGNKITNPTEYSVEDNDLVINPGTKKGYTFEGWSEDNGATKIKEYKIKKGTIGSKTLKAYYSPNLYTIEYEWFDGNKQRQTRQQQLYYDSEFSLEFVSLQDFIFDNYSIINSDGSSTILTRDYTERFKYEWDKDLRIRINFTQDINTITFDSGQYAENNPEPIEAVAGQFISEPKQPTRTGYTFKGWYDLPQVDGVAPKGFIIEFPYALIKNTTAYARWEINRYTTTFNPMGGTWPTNEDTIILRNSSQEQVYPIYANYNDIIQTAPRVKRFGFTFLGWYTREDFRPDSQIFNVENGYEQHYQVVKDADVFAKWQANDININFINTDPNNQVAESQLDLKYTTTYQFPVPKERSDGYEFIGWSLENASNGKIFNVKDLEFTQTPEQPLTLYSVWAYHTYKVSIDTRGGTPVNSTIYNVNDNQILARFNETIKLPTTKQEDLELTTKPGYTFAGWYLDDEETPTSEDNKITYSFTILAKWNIITDYKLQYSAVDIEDKDTELEVDWKDQFSPGSVKEQAYTVEETVVLPSPIKEGYRFLGWTVKQHPTNESHTDQTVKQNVDKMVPEIGYTIYKGTYGTKEFVANFVKNSYTLTYVFNDEKKTVISTKQKFDTEFSPIRPERQGYDFECWQHGTECLLNDVQKYKYPNDITVSAKWVKKTFSVTFIDDVLNQVHSQTFEYGAVLETTTAEEKGKGYKVGFILQDWQLRTPSGLNDVIRPYLIYEDSIFQAKYKIRDYKLTYSQEGFKDVLTYQFGQEITKKDPRKTRATEGKKFLGYFFTNPETGKEEKLQATYSYDFDITATPKFDAEYFFVIIDTNGGSLPSYSDSKDTKITTYQLGLLNGEELRELYAEKPHHEIEYWYVDGNTSNVAKFPYTVTKNLYIKVQWKRKQYKLTFNKQKESPRVRTVESGTYTVLEDISVSNQEDNEIFKGYYYFENPDDINTKKYLPKNLYYDFDKDITVFAEYVERKIKVKFIYDINPADKEEKIQRGEDPYPYIEETFNLRHQLKLEDIEKHAELTNAKMQERKDAMYIFKGWSTSLQLGEHNNPSYISYPTTLTQVSYIFYPVYVARTYKIEYYYYNNDGIVQLHSTEDAYLNRNHVLKYNLKSDTDIEIFSHYLLGGKRQEEVPLEKPEELADKSNVVYQMYKYTVDNKDDIKTIRLYPVYVSFTSYIIIRTYYSSDLLPRSFFVIPTKFNEKISSKEELIEKIKAFFGDNYYNIKPGYEIEGFRYDSSYNGHLTIEFPDYINTAKHYFVIWKPRLFNLTYNYNYEENGQPKKETLQYFANQRVPNNRPQRDGYNFSGWYYDKELTKLVSNTNYNEDYTFEFSNQDTEFYAKWDEQTNLNVRLVTGYSLETQRYEFYYTPSKPVTLPQDIVADHSNGYYYEVIGYEDQNGNVYGSFNDGLISEVTIGYEQNRKGTYFLNVKYQPKYYNIKLYKKDQVNPEIIQLGPNKGYNFKTNKLYRLKKDVRTLYKDQLVESKPFITLKTDKYINMPYFSRYYIIDNDVEIEEVEPNDYQNKQKNIKISIKDVKDNNNMDEFDRTNTISGIWPYNILDEVNYYRLSNYINGSNNDKKEIVELKVKYTGDSDFTKEYSKDEILKLVKKTQETTPNEFTISAFSDGVIKSVEEIFVKFVWKTYTIEYDLDGGQEESTSALPKSYKWPERVNFGTPTKQNHVFYNFIDQNGFSRNGNNNPKNFSYDMKLKAIWTPLDLQIRYFQGFDNNKENGPTNQNYKYGSEVTLPFPNRINGYHIFLGWQLTDQLTKQPLTDIRLPGVDGNQYDNLKEYNGVKFIEYGKPFILTHTQAINAYPVYKKRIVRLNFHKDDETIIKRRTGSVGGFDFELRLYEEGKTYQQSTVYTETEIDTTKEYLFEYSHHSSPKEGINFIYEKEGYTSTGFDARVQRATGLDQNFEPTYDNAKEEFVSIYDENKKFGEEIDYTNPVKGFTFNTYWYSDTDSNIFNFRNGRLYLSSYIHIYPKFIRNRVVLRIANHSITSNFITDVNTSAIAYIEETTFRDIKLPNYYKNGYRLLGYSLDSTDKTNLFMTYTKDHFDQRNKKDTSVYLYPVFEENARVTVNFKPFEIITEQRDELITTKKFDIFDSNIRLDNDDKLLNYDKLKVFYNNWNTFNVNGDHSYPNSFRLNSYKILEGMHLDAYVRYDSQNINMNYGYVWYDVNSNQQNNNFQNVNRSNSFNSNYYINNFHWTDRVAIQNNSKYSKGLKLEIGNNIVGYNRDIKGFIIVNNSDRPINEKDGTELEDKLNINYLKEEFYFNEETISDYLTNIKTNGYRLLYVFTNTVYTNYYHNLKDLTNPEVTEFKLGYLVSNNYEIQEQNSPLYTRLFKYYNNNYINSISGDTISNPNQAIHVYPEYFEKQIQLRYVLNGANTSKPLKSHIVVSENITLPNLEFVAKEFKGWNVKVNNELIYPEPKVDLVLDLNEIYNIHQQAFIEIYLEAVFEDKTYDLEIDLGNNKKEVKKVRYNEEVILPNLTNSNHNPGYDFVEWRGINYSSTYNTFRMTYTYNFQLKAVWKRTNIQVIFYNEDMSKEYEQDYIRYYNHNQNTFTFNETVYEPIIEDKDLHIDRVEVVGNNITTDVKFPYIINKDHLNTTSGNRIVFKVYRKQNTYDLIYDYDGGYEDPANPNPLTYQLQADGNKLIRIHRPLKFGSDFIGYTIDTIEPDPVLDLQIDTTAHRKNLIIKANWKPKSQTVTFDQIYGVNERVKLVTIPYGYKVARPKDPEHFGYRFVHWYSDDMFVPFRFENTNIRKDITIKALYQRYMQVVSVDYEKDKPNTIILNFGDYIPNFSNLSYNKAVLDKLFEKIIIPVNIHPTLVEPVNNNKLEFTFDTKDIYDNMIITFKKDMPIFTFIDQQARATGLLTNEIKVVYYDKKFTQYIKAESFEVPNSNNRISFNNKNEASFFVTVKNADATVVPTITGFDEAEYKLELVDRVRSINQFEYKLTRLTQNQDDLVINVDIPELERQTFTIFNQ